MSKLLFVSMAARIIYDDQGNPYLNSHMNRNTVERYANLCDCFTMFLRDSRIRLSEAEAKERCNPFPLDLADLIVEYDPYSPVWNWLNLSQRKRFDAALETAILDADKVIFSAASNFYVNKGINFCKKYGKPYLVLNGGFSFETDWNNKNPLGKLLAPIREYRCRKNLAEAPYALYVTNWSLQKRYPCKGVSVGCSDVEIPKLTEDILEKRQKKIFALPAGKLTLGTIGEVDNRNKSQTDVIRAISRVKQALPEMRFEYQLVGGGNPEKLLKAAEKWGVADCVKVIGQIPHSEIYSWLDQIDIYIQPSRSEGLCRAVVEAMSRACPVICSTAGGNVELCSEEFSFRAGKIDRITDCLIRMCDVPTLHRQAERSFAAAKAYESEKLDEIRNAFLQGFLYGVR